MKMNNKLWGEYLKFSGDVIEMKLYACLKEILQTNGDEFGLFHSLELSNLHLQIQPRQHILNQRPLMEKDIVIVNKTHRYIMVVSVKRELKDIIISKPKKPKKTLLDKISDELLDAKSRLESWFSTEVDSSWKFIPIIYSLWGFLHLKSELIREAENQKTDKNHRKTVKYGSIFEGEIT